MMGKLMPGLVLLLLLLLLVTPARTKDETAADTGDLIVTNERQAHWIDYIAGVATEGGALGLVRWLANALGRGVNHATERDDEGLAHLLGEILEGLEDRIPEPQRKEFKALRLNQGSIDVPWLVNANDCQGERCTTLGKVTNLLIDYEAHDAQGAHDLMQELLRRDSKARKSREAKQMAFVAALVAYDEMAAEACAPVWAPGDRQLSVDGKRLLLEGVISLLRGQVKPSTVEEACRKYMGGLHKNDMNCLHALTAVGFEPVQKVLEAKLRGRTKGHEQTELQRLLACIRGRIDPCDAISQGTQLFPPYRPLLKRMQEGFGRKCELRKAVEHITSACPNPGASLPLARVLRERGLPESKWEDARRDEVWFWIHVLTQQCKEAASLWEHFRNLYGQEESAVFPMRRMAEAIDECRELTIKGLEKAERTHGVLRLLKEGRFADAKSKIAAGRERKKKGDRIGKEARYYYETVMLMLQEHPRSLELSDLVSISLFRPNEYERNAHRLRQLDALSKGGNIADMEMDGDDELGALILLMAGRAADVIKLYESVALGEEGSEQPVLCELVATAYICERTSKRFCSPSMSVLIERALDLLNLKPKSDLYESIREAVCKLVEGKVEGGWPMREDTSLIRTRGSYKSIFGSGYFGRIFGFPNDPKDEGYEREEDKDVDENENEDEVATTTGTAPEEEEEEDEKGQVTEDEEKEIDAVVLKERVLGQDKETLAKDDEDLTEDERKPKSSEGEILSEQETGLEDDGPDEESQEQQSQDDEYDQQVDEEAEVGGKVDESSSQSKANQSEEHEVAEEDTSEDYYYDKSSGFSPKEEAEITVSKVRDLFGEKEFGGEIEVGEPEIDSFGSPYAAHTGAYITPIEAQGELYSDFYVPTDADEQDFGPRVDPVTLIPTHIERDQREFIAT